jgi:hypothetical protein
MTKSIRKKQKLLRRKAKPQDVHEQSQSYWPRELKRRDQINDFKNENHLRNL